MCLGSGCCTCRNCNCDMQNRDILKFKIWLLCRGWTFLTLYYKYTKHRTMAGSLYTDGHNYYLLRILWKYVRQMCFECPFYCVSNTSVSFPICRKNVCLRTHRSHFVRQMCYETNVLLHTIPISVLRYFAAISMHRVVKCVLHLDILEFINSLRCIHRGQGRSRCIDASMNRYTSNSYTLTYFFSLSVICSVNYLFHSLDNILIF
jgi:hypothetical protein